MYQEKIAIFCRSFILRTAVFTVEDWQVMSKSGTNTILDEILFVNLFVRFSKVSIFCTNKLSKTELNSYWTKTRKWPNQDGVTELVQECCFLGNQNGGTPMRPRPLVSRTVCFSVWICKLDGLCIFYTDNFMDDLSVFSVKIAI